MRSISVFAVLLLLFIADDISAQLKLSSIFSDNMVLQQDKPNKVWGWAKPGATVQLSFLGKNYSTKASASGEWMMTIAPNASGKTGDMEITSLLEKQVIHNVIMGEVWICSGQSNMDYTMNEFADAYTVEKKTANDKNIRFVVVRKTFDKKERKDVIIERGWSSIDTGSVRFCSAVAYFYAKKLRERLNRPVGLIISSWWGTPAESWVDKETIAHYPVHKKVFDDKLAKIDFESLDQIKKRNEERYSARVAQARIDLKDYIPAAYDDASWADIMVPKNWEEQGYPDLDGIAVYRIAFDLPADMAGKAAELNMPGIDDIDSSFINGTFVGSMNIWNAHRKYAVPAGSLRAGRNMLTIWVEDGRGGGGLNNEPDQFYLSIGDQKFVLNGKAKFKVLAPMEPLATGVNYADLQNQPTLLFNAMIAPLLSYTIRGAIWYQGESNVDRYKEYRKLFPDLIRCWRNRWNNPELAFFFVQLSSYNPSHIEPEFSPWAFMREAQTYALTLPLTGMAVSTDVGDADDIHPKRKKEVGYRLGANALNIVYGFKDLLPAGPMFISARKETSSLVITYKFSGSGLMSKGDSLKGFMIAGADKKFVKAEARIRGNEVIVSSADIKAPKFVRYAWGNSPMDANLFNKEGLPAVPFRTDKDDR